MQEIFAPATGMASTEVYLMEWLKEPGARVAEGEAVARIETDKAEVDVEAPANGVLGSHRFAEGAAVPNGATIAVLLEENEAEPSGDGRAVEAAQPAAAPRPEEREIVPTTQSAPVVEKVASAPTPSDRERDSRGELLPHLLSPRERSGVAPTPQIASAPQATRDVPTPSAPEDGAVARHRRAVSAAVSKSWSEIPHFAVTTELRVDRLMEVLRSFRAIDPTVTFTDVVLKAFALALIARSGSVDVSLGLAVATERGVAIPVLRNVATASLLEIAVARSAAIERAQAGRSNADDAIVPESTLSNLGAYGVEWFTGIVPSGQTSILTVGAAAKRPVVVDDELSVATTMFATLNVDHRAWDGQHVGEVLKRLAGICAEPALLLALR